MKQNKNVKQKGLVQRLNEMLAMPDEKKCQKIKLPAGKMLMNTVDHDLMVSILVVSVFVNITLFVAWLIIQADPTIKLALISLR